MGCQLCAVARFIEGQRTFSVLSPQWASLLTDHSNSGMREKGKRLRPIIRLVSVEKKRLEVLAGPPLLGLTWEHLAWASCCLGGCSQHAPSTNSSLCLCVSVSLSFSLSLSFSYSLSLSLFLSVSLLSLCFSFYHGTFNFHKGWEIRTWCLFVPTLFWTTVLLWRCRVDEWKRCLMNHM